MSSLGPARISVSSSLEGLVRLGETVFIAGRSLAADSQDRYAIADTQVQFLQGFLPKRNRNRQGQDRILGRHRQRSFVLRSRVRQRPEKFFAQDFSVIDLKQVGLG